MSSQPRLAVHAGPSLGELTPVTVNAATPHPISSPSYEGAVSVRIQDYLGPKGGEGKPLPEHEMRDGATWSIAMQGRWKEDVDADDVMWGNCWSSPIRDYLPYGTSAALKFVHLVDPALSHDIYADRPWALSPLVATMNYVQATREPVSPDWTPDQIKEDVTALFRDSTPEVDAMIGDSAKRKRWMNDAAKRKRLVIPSDVTVSCDFCNGYIDFATLSLKLPVGLSFALESYWDGQPVTFVCRNKSGTKEYFFVTFQIVRDGEHIPEPRKKSNSPEVEDKDDLGID